MDGHSQDGSTQVARVLAPRLRSKRLEADLHEPLTEREREVLGLASRTQAALWAIEHKLA
jgi:DNA-binding NarL/FixJ family response regulator